MKAQAKSVYFESGCEKLACETFKSLDSCAVTKKNESYVLPLTIEQTEKKGERVEFWQKKKIAAFSIRPVWSKSMLQQIH